MAAHHEQLGEVRIGDKMFFPIQDKVIILRDGRGFVIKA